MTPQALVSKLRRLGLVIISSHSSKNYVWMELLNEDGHQIALANIPTSKPQVSVGVLTRTLHRMGIRDQQHLEDLLGHKDPPASLRLILPEDAARYRPGGQ